MDQVDRSTTAIERRLEELKDTIEAAAIFGGSEGAKTRLGCLKVSSLVGAAEECGIAEDGNAGLDLAKYSLGSGWYD